MGAINRLILASIISISFLSISVMADYSRQSEKKSETEYSLPGDAIHHFRVVESNAMDLTIEVDYSYNKQHGNRVLAGAGLSPTQSGYKITYVPTPRRGTVRIRMTLYDDKPSEEISIFLYEWGKPAEEFAKRTYSFKRGWGH